MKKAYQKAILLAAGYGSRLSPYTQLIPKPLMPIIRDEYFNRGLLSIIEYLLLQLKSAKILEMIIVVHYGGEKIKEFLEDGSRYGVVLKYVEQKELLGNGNAFYCGKKLLSGSEEKVIILDCDNFINDKYFFKSMCQFHDENNLDISVAVCHVENPKKFAIIKTDEKGHPKEIIEKPQTNLFYWGNLAKSGIFVLSKKCLSYSNKVVFQDKEQSTTEMIAFFLQQKDINMKLYSIKNQFNDIGTWEEYLPILKKNL